MPPKQSFLNLQHSRALQTFQKCKFLHFTLDPLNQTIAGRGGGEVVLEFAFFVCLFVLSMLYAQCEA